MYLAQGDTNAAVAQADAFLAQLATLQGGEPRGGGVFACLRDSQCVQEVLADTAASVPDAQAATTTTVASQDSSQVAAEAPSASVEQAPVESEPVDGFSTGARRWDHAAYECGHSTRSVSGPFTHKTVRNFSYTYWRFDLLGLCRMSDRTGMIVLCGFPLSLPIRV